MIFAAREMFWLLLLLVAPLIGFYAWAWKRRQQLMTQFISSRLLNQLKVGVSQKRQKIKMALLVSAVTFLVITLARPQWGVTRSEAHQRGLDIIVAVDTSNSMLAEDTPPNRLAKAKLAALDLMKKARNDRLGLVAFAGAAFLECPLTLDDAVFSQSINALDTKTISQGGTAIAQAIEEAAKAFKRESDNHKVLVLFTDGEDLDGEAVAAAEKAAKEGVIIFTVGIGSVEGETLRIRDERGRLDYILDENNQPVKSHLNEELLKNIAKATHGFYLPLRGTKTIDNLYESGIAPLPKSELVAKTFQSFHERFQWPLAIAIILLIGETFWPEKKRRRSRKGSVADNSPVTETIVILLALLFVAHQGAASPASALREYNAGKYEEALKDYNASLEKKQDDVRLHFNAGTAAYQSHQLETAAKEFNEALNSPDLPLQQQAYYNLANTLYRQGQAIQEPEKKQEAWENALKNYDNALKLNPQDADAKFNQGFVNKQLEELKKQQQKQQQQNKSDKDQNKKDDKKDQQKQDQKPGQDKNQSGDKDQKPENQNQDKQSQDQKKEEQQSSDKKDSEAQKKKDSAQKQKQEAKKAEDEKKAAEQKKKDEESGQAGEPSPEQAAEDAKRDAKLMAEGKMIPKQAQQLLDSQKDEDRVFQLMPTNQSSRVMRPDKNY